MDKRCANDGDIVLLWHICFEKNYFFIYFYKNYSIYFPKNYFSICF